jgi:polysaccharide biosynthesis transport protein
MTPTADSTISYRQLASIFRARRGTMLVVFVSVVALAAVLSAVVPKRYTAGASVVVDGRSKDLIDGSALLNLSIPGYLSTQVNIIKSERVTLRVIRELKLGDVAANREDWMSDTDGQGDYESWLAVKIAKKLDARPARDSSVIDITYSARDPKYATAVANAYLKAYLDTSLDLRVDPAKKTNDFFDERTKLARQDLESAQNKLSKYQQSAGIVTTDERLDIENAKLNDLSARMIAQQSVAGDSSTRSAAAGASRDLLSDVMNDRVVAGIRSDIAREQAKLDELKQRYGDNHPQVMQSKAGITQLQAELNRESAKVASSLKVGNTIDRTRMAELGAALEEQRNKVMRMKLGRDQASVMQRDVENAQRAYETVIARVTQTNLESQSTQSNVSVLKHATVPGEASFPRMGLNLAIAAALGLLLGFPIALIREMRDRRVYVEEDVVRGLQVPMLATLPVVTTLARKKQPAAIGTKARVLGLPRFSST